MAACEGLNQKEIVGLYRGALNLKPSMSQKHCHVLIELMRMLLRLKLDTTYQAETNLMLPLFDEALCACWDHLKRGRVGPEEFWRLYGDVGSLVMMSDDVLAVFACGTKYKTVSDEIIRCTNGCKLGTRMFGQAWLWMGICLMT